MPKYRVVFTEVVERTYDYEVTAPSIGEATNLAMTAWENGEVSVLGITVLDFDISSLKLIKDA